MKLPDTNIENLSEQNRAGARAIMRDGVKGVLHGGKDFVWQWQERHRSATGHDGSKDLLIGLYCIITGVMVAVLFDEMAVRVARELNAGWYVFFAFVTDFGKSGYLFLLTGVTCLAAAAMTGIARRPANRAAIGLLAGRTLFLFTVLLISGIASLVLKRIGRGRPKLMDEGGPFQFDPLSFQNSWASLPSGHTITIFAFAVALGFLLPRWRVPLLLIALLVGISRVVLGAHYPSDVMAGACIGIASAVLLRRMFAARNIVFAVARGVLTPRGQGVIPSLLRKSS